MTAERPSENIGLCAHCQHLRRVHSERGATFYLCRRAAADPHYPKYPPLPVLTCLGYEPAKNRNPP